MRDYLIFLSDSGSLQPLIAGVVYERSIQEKTLVYLSKLTLS